MIRDKISQAIRQAIGEIPPGHEIEKIKERKLGDFASNLGFLWKRGNLKEVIQELKRDKDFASVCLVKGYLNFRFSLDYLRNTLPEAAKKDFGQSNLGKGEKVLLEFISANPTGPLSVVQARAGALGDALARILTDSGYQVKTEYYVNDCGSQVDLLLASLLERIKEAKGEPFSIPPGGYPGEYLKEIADEILEKGIEDKRGYLLERILRGQKESLANFRIHFDNFVKESSIRPKVKSVLAELKEKGYTYEKEGALYFTSSRFGDQEDRVLITKDGRYTYFATDLAYHKDKLERGFSRLLNIWGPDHHGYIPRMKAGIAALGFEPERLTILIAQQVSLLRGKETVKMSKRGGEFITLDEVLEEIGRDTLKFYLLMRHFSQGIQFDLESAKRETKENPIYYVQYAHARLNSLLKFAKEKGYGQELAEDQTLLFLGEKERDLILSILYFPDMVKMAAVSLEPHFITYYLIDLAESFHNYYERERVVSEDTKLTKARLVLCRILRDVFRKGLSLLGIEPKEKM